VDGPNPLLAGEPPTEGVVTHTFTLNERDMASGIMLMLKRTRWSLPLMFAWIGAAVSSPWGLSGPVQIGIVIAAAVIGWLVWPLLFGSRARRSIANKSDADLTFTWRFSPDWVEITTRDTYARLRWSAIHRFLEGPKSFVVYTGETVAQVIPKRALGSEGVEALRAVFTSRITPRGKPPRAPGTSLLWVLLVLMFLAVWQFLQAGR